jgi:hypothetical protein
MRSRASWVCGCCTSPPSSSSIYIYPELIDLFGYHTRPAFCIMMISARAASRHAMDRQDKVNGRGDSCARPGPTSTLCGCAPVCPSASRSGARCQIRAWDELKELALDYDRLYRLGVANGLCRASATTRPPVDASRALIAHTLVRCLPRAAARGRARAESTECAPQSSASRGPTPRHRAWRCPSYGTTFIFRDARAMVATARRRARCAGMHSQRADRGADRAPTSRAPDSGVRRAGGGWTRGKAGMCIRG